MNPTLNPNLTYMNNATVHLSRQDAFEAVARLLGSLSAITDDAVWIALVDKAVADVMIRRVSRAVAE
jgi:hypothetical protein